MKKYRYHILLFLTVFIWGSSYVAGKSVLAHVPPMLLLFFRFGGSFVAMLLLVKKLHLPKIEKSDLKYVVIIGFVGYFLSNFFVTLSIQYANASVASLINAMNPVSIMVFAAIFLGEKMTRRKIIALAVALTGVVIIIGVPGGGVSVAGVVLGIFAVLVWSYATVFSKRLSDKYNALTITTYGLGVATAVSLLSAVGEQVAFKTSVVFTGMDVFSIIYLSLICTALAYVMWNKCLTVLSASKCGSFYPIQPMASMLLGVLLLHEPMTGTLLVGSVLIIASVLLNP